MPTLSAARSLRIPVCFAPVINKQNGSSLPFISDTLNSCTLPGLQGLHSYVHTKELALIVAVASILQAVHP